MLLASGKVVYDLEAARDKAGDEATAIVRVEQLAPLPANDIAHELAKYPERRRRLGAGRAAEPGRLAVHGAQPARALAELGETRQLRVVSRRASASPATGSSKKHQAEQQELIEAAFPR